MTFLKGDCSSNTNCCYILCVVALSFSFLLLSIFALANMRLHLVKCFQTNLYIIHSVCFHGISSCIWLDRFANVLCNSNESNQHDNKIFFLSFSVPNFKVQIYTTTAKFFILKKKTKFFFKYIFLSFASFVCVSTVSRWLIVSRSFYRCEKCFSLYTHNMRNETAGIVYI